MSTSLAMAGKTTINARTHELTAAALLEDALRGTGAAVIANRTFRSLCGGTTRGRETDFVILHPQKGVIVVELKSCASSVFFAEVEMADPGMPGHPQTICLAKNAMAQVTDATWIVMNEIKPYLASLSTDRPRAFDPALLRRSEPEELYSLGVPIVAVFPSIPEHVVVPEQGAATVMGFDTTLALLADPVGDGKPFFYADEIDFLFDVLARDRNDERWLPGRNALSRAAATDRVLRLGQPVSAKDTVARAGSLSGERRLRTLAMATSTQAQKTALQGTDVRHAVALAKIAHPTVVESYRAALAGGMSDAVVDDIHGLLDDLASILDECEAPVLARLRA